jgi:hypothetical protein
VAGGLLETLVDGEEQRGVGLLQQLVDVEQSALHHVDLRPVVAEPF